MKKALLSLLGITVCLIVSAPPASADVNDFTIADYKIHFTLGRDDDKRSILTTEETIVADFPQVDQNHGIERYIPSNYDGHPTSLNVLSVTNQKSEAWGNTSYDSGDYKVLRIGDADRYVHGRETFIITYTQRDVTRYFEDARRDEFYWDTNGTAWRVPISALNVSLSVDKNLEDALTGDVKCYQGVYGSSAGCDIKQDGTMFTAAGRNLAIGENITLAVGFKPQTFAKYEPSLFEKMVNTWLWMQLAILLPAIGLFIFLIIRFTTWSRRKSELGTIIPEYLPPKEASITLAASVIATRSTFAAQLIDLAVRHYFKIYETKKKSLWSRGTYEIEIVKSIDGLRDEEKEFVSDVFKSDTQVGAKISTDSLRNDYSLSSRMMDNPKKLKALIRGQYNLQQKDPGKATWFKKFGLFLLGLTVLMLSPVLFVVSLTALIMSTILWVFTDKGLSLYRYLEGLKMYISVAEEDRLKMLQSPEGAEKVQVDGSDQKQLIKLYEKVLPYAVLFGQEAEWNKQLGHYYEATGTRPDWYTGTSLGAFNAAAFSGAMSGLTTSINSSGAASSSSSGSSGGGSSGGGGGGGGGGGW